MATITTRRPNYCDNLPAIEADLAEGADRLRMLVAPSEHSGQVLTAEALHEIVLIYSNTAYTFAYLEGSQRFDDYQHLLRWHEAYFHDRDLTVATEKALAAAGPFTAHDLEELRLTWLAWFADRKRAPEQMRRRQAELGADMRAILRQMDAHQLDFLQRFKINSPRTSPSVMLAETASRLKEPTTRTKLTTAWRRHSAPYVAALTNVLDEAVEVRRRAVREGAGGHSTVLAQTFESCSVSPAEATSFLQEFLTQALESQRELESAIRAATGCTEHPMDHFGRYVRTRMSGRRAPTFKLQALLDLLCALAWRVLGVTVTAAPAQHTHALTFRVSGAGEELGSIDFDLLRPGGRSHRTVSPPLTAKCETSVPVKAKAHVLCPLHPDHEDNHVTFAAAQAIFHEFGHALTHVLLPRRMPSESGVEYLPLDRLECASTWWERWVYHPDFASTLDPTGEAHEALSHSQQLRALETWSTTLQCTVAAAVDLDVHGRSDGGHREAFERLSQEFSLGDHCAFGDLPGYFTHLTWQAAPGAGFLYLWGAASSAEVFKRYQSIRVADLPAKGLPDELTHLWLDSTLPSPRPSVEPYFEFLRDVVDTGPMEVARV
ncbi:M3 family metallopeptidase [Streptomyces sp. NPDC002680]|uniref:M3 family metallopeptidase n=1 Tax=Streptomyces sp. NPDC002680 TaxID=3364659 RepID=UPI0036C0206D